MKYIIDSKNKNKKTLVHVPCVLGMPSGDSVRQEKASPVLMRISLL